MDSDNPEIESNSKFLNNLSQDTFKSKGKSHKNLKSPLFFLKENKLHTS